MFDIGATVMAHDNIHVGSLPYTGNELPVVTAARPSHLPQQPSQSTIIFESPMQDVTEQPLPTPWLRQTMDLDTPPQRLTRSVTKNNPVFLLTGEEAPIETKLRASAKRVRPSSVLHSLESSRSIIYGDDGEEIIKYAPTRKVRIQKSSRARRGRVLKQLCAAGDDLSPPNNAATPSSRSHARKRSSPKAVTVSCPRRRSPRLAKPLTEFHLFGQLPRELQLMIWEAAIEPRVVYLRNRSVFQAPYTREIQNEQPVWSLACQTSWYVAQMRYRIAFGLVAGINRPADPAHRQAFVPHMDIALLEPCCAGCRAYGCTRSQFSASDRELVRNIAVQVESPLLMPTASPCWHTISLSWPNVEVIYMTRESFIGDDRKPKALIRIAENDHEKWVHQRFLYWKKTEGRNNKIQKIEFVTVVHREEGKLEDRYQNVAIRKTGGPSDVLLG